MRQNCFEEFKVRSLSWISNEVRLEREDAWPSQMQGLAGSCKKIGGYEGNGNMSNGSVNITNSTIYKIH